MEKRAINIMPFVPFLQNRDKQWCTVKGDGMSLTSRRTKREMRRRRRSRASRIAASRCSMDY
jgi:hypothetical protein